MSDGSMADLRRQVIDLTESTELPVVHHRKKRPHVEGTPVVPKNGPKARNWCFTLNNPLIRGDDFLEQLKTVPGFRYVVFQQERGENGTPHFQGYIQFGVQKTLQTLKNQVSNAAHFEMARGTVEDNKKYCTKEETRVDGPWTFGEAVSERQRSDLLAVAKKLQAGATLQQVAQEFPVEMIRYGSGLYKYKRACPPPPLLRQVECALYIGPTGTGKTYKALMDNPEDVFKKDRTQWWDGYNGQKTVVMDEFVGAASKIQLDHLLQLLDPYRVQTEVKGGFEWLLAERIIFTSNLHPWNWYDIGDRLEQYKALARRFARVLIFTDHQVWTELTGEAKTTFFMDPEFYGYQKTGPVGQKKTPL